jgi:hypothetical protein
VARDGAGNVYVTGIFGNFFGAPATFGPLSGGGSVTLTSAGLNDMFLAKYDAAGTLQWVRQAGGTGSDARQQRGGGTPRATSTWRALFQGTRCVQQSGSERLAARLRELRHLRGESTIPPATCSGRVRPAARDATWARALPWR